MKALDQLRLVRFQVSYDGVGSRELSNRFAYVYHNPTSAPISVAPLTVVSHRIHNNMRVLGPDGKHLILLDSQTSRRALAAYAELTRTRIIGHLKALAKESKHIREDDVDALLTAHDVAIAFRSRFRDSKAEEGPWRPSKKDLQRSEENTHTALDRLFRKLENAYTKFPRADYKHARSSSTSDPYFMALRALYAEVVEMTWLINTRSSTMVPFALIPEGIQAGGHYFLRQDILIGARPVLLAGARREKKPVSGAQPGVPAKNGTRLRWPFTSQRERGYYEGDQVPVEWKLEKAWRVIKSLFGNSSTALGFPLSLSVDAQSYHMRIVGAKGITIRKVKPLNLHEKSFEEDNNDLYFCSRIGNSIYYYRFGELIDVYLDETEKFAEENQWAAPLAGKLWLDVGYREANFVTWLFVIGMGLAIATPILPIFTPLTFTNLGGALLAVGGYLILRSADRPFSMWVLTRRLVTLAVLTGAAWLVAKLFIS